MSSTTLRTRPHLAGLGLSPLTVAFAFPAAVFQMMALCPGPLSVGLALFAGISTVLSSLTYTNADFLVAVTREFQPPDVTSCKLRKLAFLSTATTGTMWTERERCVTECLLPVEAALQWEETEGTQRIGHS